MLRFIFTRIPPLRWAPDAWWLDVKLGVRMLLRYPGLALAGAGGIAVAVAIAVGGFSFVYANFRASSLPLEQPDRIVSLEVWDTAAGQPDARNLYDFQAWRESLKSVQELSAFRNVTPAWIVPGGGPPESVRVALISASGFRVARVRPLLGRYLEDADERPGAPAVIVIGEDVWRNRFAADPAVLGRIIQLGATSYSVVGVMPQGFAFPVNHHMWAPLRTGRMPVEPRTGPDLQIFGRLAPDATLAGAQAELATSLQRTSQAFPKIYSTLRAQAMPYPNPYLGVHGAADMTGILAMEGLFVSLLGLVCLNVAILVYTRTAMRQTEIGLRTALGAGRARIVAQLFIEALVLSAVAAAGGVALAALALREVDAATRHIAAELPFWVSFRLSPEAVLYAVALAVFAAAIVGILPALQATRGVAQAGFRVVGAGGMRFGRTWTVLIVAQVGFAVALLPPAVSSAWKDLRDGMSGAGFAAGEFLTAQLGMDSLAETDGAAGTGRFAARQSELMRRLESDPRVSGVTFAMAHPGEERSARIEAQRPGGGVHEVRFNRVAVNFFRTFAVPVLAGRVFEPADLSSGEAVVVNQSFAQQVFGGDALGRRIRYVEPNAAAADAHAARSYQIVGIVSDFPPGVNPGMRDSPLKLYHAAAPGQVQPAAIAVRLRGGAASGFVQPLARIAAAIDPELHVRNLRPLDEALRSEQWISRLQAAVAAGVTLAVLILSSAGIYALMSFTVSQRRKEIGIRMALGADWKRIVAGIFSRAALQLAAGAALGAALNAAFARAAGADLAGGNRAVLPAVALVIMAVGFLAALGPARRSLRIQPTEALRQE